MAASPSSGCTKGALTNDVTFSFWALRGGGGLGVVVAMEIVL